MRLHGLYICSVVTEYETLYTWYGGWYFIFPPMYTKPFTVDRKQKDEHLGMLKWGYLNPSNIYKIQRFMIDIKDQTLHIRFHHPQADTLIQSGAV